MRRALIAVEHLIHDDRGQDLVEYGLLVTLIAITAVAAVGLFGTAVAGPLWSPIITGLNAI
jgi:Flp pilus assembly pilin Flp